MLKKIREFLEEKGQGAVEYALLLGFVAIVLAYFTSGSGLQDSTKKAMKNMNNQATAITSAYNANPDMT